MKKIEVGLRMDSKQGVSFFGTDEVNKLLSCGSKIIALEPGGAITRQIQSDDGTVRLVVSGFSLIIKLVEPDIKQ